MAIVLTFKRKRMINLNKLAVRISRLEGGKKQVDIAQIKEVLKHTLATLGGMYDHNPKGVVALLERVADTAEAISRIKK